MHNRHGLSKHPLYRVWAGILARCYTLSAANYNFYGGIGVRVCDLWKNDFTSFYEWALSKGWQKGMQIDKDILAKQKNMPPNMYSPELCSIVTSKENCNTKKSNRVIEYNGVSLNIKQWANKIGINRTTIYLRLKNGWTVEDALTKEIDCNSIKKRIKCITTNEEFDSVSNAARAKKIPACYISGVLTGKHKHSAGLKFEYIK